MLLLTVSFPIHESKNWKQNKTRQDKKNGRRTERESELGASFQVNRMSVVCVRITRTESLTQWRYNNMIFFFWLLTESIWNECLRARAIIKLNQLSLFLHMLHSTRV